MTDTHPRLSTALRFLIIAFSFAIFWVPNACTMVTIEPRASGIAATARATANIIESSTAIFLYIQRTNTSAHTIMINAASLALNLSRLS